MRDRRFTSFMCVSDSRITEKSLGSTSRMQPVQLIVRLAQGEAAASALQMLEWPRTSHFYGQTEGGNDESISSRVRNGDVRIFLARSCGRVGTRPRRAPHGCAQGPHL